MPTKPTRTFVKGFGQTAFAAAELIQQALKDLASLGEAARLFEQIPEMEVAMEKVWEARFPGDDAMETWRQNERRDEEMIRGNHVETTLERVDLFTNREYQLMHRILDQNAQIMGQNRLLVEALLKTAEAGAMPPRFDDRAFSELRADGE